MCVYMPMFDLTCYVIGKKNHINSLGKWFQEAYADHVTLRLVCVSILYRHYVLFHHEASTFHFSCPWLCPPGAKICCWIPVVVTGQACDANPHWSLQTRRTIETRGPDCPSRGRKGNSGIQCLWNLWNLWKTHSQLAQFNLEEIAQTANQSETARPDVLIALGMR